MNFHSLNALVPVLHIEFITLMYFKAFMTKMGVCVCVCVFGNIYTSPQVSSGISQPYANCLRYALLCIADNPCPINHTAFSLLTSSNMTTTGNHIPHFVQDYSFLVKFIPFGEMSFL